MESVLRAAAIYVFLLVLFRITGRRALSEITTFDFVLLLVIGEATQQALLGDDFSVINAFVVIGTLVLIDILLSLFKQRSPQVGRFLDGMPLIVVEYGKPLTQRLRKARLTEEDILEAARQSQGLERMEQIRFAVLEKNGQISVIPEPGDR
ncbi:membrane protein [Pseudomonas oryzihabitans]|nr:membrane protein [Pseudomonas psychrotolerans]KTT00052.1 membrane protein [Pseudomonas psychrotolerans]KTT22346.1 membrane protein [Pseudomonas psychrotolerans]KTT52127.1 membrane protein [Pseudomonas psychrotolerans]KTT57922.1 membrane protein [Pseudomonas psychrotolerans]